MEYFDKRRNRRVVLEPRPAEFLVVTKPGDQENAATLRLRHAMRGRMEAAAPGAFWLKLDLDEENVSAAQAELDALKQDGTIDAVAQVFDSDTGPMYGVPDRVAVLVRGLSDAKARQAFRGIGLKVLEKGRTKGLYTLAVPDGETLGDAIAALNAIPEVQLAEPVFIGVGDRELSVAISRADVVGPASGSGVGDDGGGGDDGASHEHGAPSAGASCPLAWNHDRVRAASAWQISRGDPSIVIAVVDGLPEVAHEALAGRAIAPIAEEMFFSDRRPVSGHATNVTSLACGASGCFTGLAPECRYLPLVVDLDVQAYVDRADAIFYAAERAQAKTVAGHGFQRMVMTCSWKMSGDVSIVRIALEEAVQAGILVVTSAGNNNSSAPHYPSDYGALGGALGDGVLSIAATDQTDAKASYSNWSDRVDMSAPGGDGLPLDEGDLLCADLGGSYLASAGTSLAAPQVAAAAALLLSRDPTLPPAELKRLLRQTADRIPTPRPIGAGRLNALGALQALNPQPSAPEGETPRTVEPGPAPSVTPAVASGIRVVVTIAGAGGEDSGVPAAALDGLAADFAEAVRTATDWTLASVDFRNGVRRRHIAFND